MKDNKCCPPAGGHGPIANGVTVWRSAWWLQVPFSCYGACARATRWVHGTFWLENTVEEPPAGQSIAGSRTRGEGGGSAAQRGAARADAHYTGLRGSVAGLPWSSCQGLHLCAGTVDRLS